MTNITPETIIGAVVTEVIADGSYIECIKLRDSKGREIDVIAFASTDIDEDPWMEVM